VTEELPRDLSTFNQVENQAMDVQSASMLYIALSLRHDTTPFGTIGCLPIYMIGKMFRTIFTGDGKLDQSISSLKECVPSYNEALVRSTFAITHESPFRLNSKIPTI
jgi:hypothetical protein